MSKGPPSLQLEGPWVLENRLVPLETPKDFEPRTFEFDSEVTGLENCVCPHCGETVSYVVVCAPEVVTCPTCEGEIPIPRTSGDEPDAP